MIDCGIVLFAITVILACAGPAEKVLMSRRHHRAELVAGPVPCARANPVLEQLVANADAALERDDLVRGVRAVERTYRRAARRR